MFGCLVSIFSKKKGNLDLIYIPKINKMLLNNVKRICKKPKKIKNIFINKMFGNKNIKDRFIECMEVQLTLFIN